MHAAHRMPYGATVLDRGGVAFALWAPAARSVELQIEGTAGAPPRRLTASPGTPPQDADLYRVEVPSAAPGTRYRWCIDGGQLVPDPASRSNPDGPHGPSEVIDPKAFAWHEAEARWRGRAWHECVVYELHIGSFTPEGSYAAAARRLPALVRLGISVVELMPLASFPGRFGWGYDGVLPFAPQAAYGHPDELKAFVQTAHQLGLAVWLDVVYNHFGPDGNYLHAYAPAFFSKTHRTAWGDGLNFDGPLSARVRDFFIHNALYWLGEYRFDGLRLDAVHAIADDGELHILEALSRAVREAAGPRQLHLVLENETSEAERLAAPGTPGRYDGQWHDELHHAFHVLLTGERGGYYAPFVPALPALGRLLAGGSTGVGAIQRATPDALPSRYVNFLQNHDQIGNRARGDRLSTLADPAALRLATAVLLLAPGVPMLFMGEEVDERRPFFYFADWASPLREAVREGRAREFAAFIAEGGGELPDPCDAATWRASQLDPASVGSAGARRFDEIRGWINLRRRVLEPLLPRLKGGTRDASAGKGKGKSGKGAAEHTSHSAAWPHVAHVQDGTRLTVRWRFEGGEALELRGQFAATPATWADEPSWPALLETETFAQVGAVEGPARGEHFGAWSARWALGREAGTDG